MFTLTNSQCVPLTKDLAEKFQSMKASPTEREFDPKRVQYLKTKAEQGRLVTFQWASAKLNGENLRMNGQHSSRMLNELNGKFPEGLKVHLDEYAVEDAEDLALLFRQFDDRRSARTAVDVSGAYQGCFTDLASVPRDIAKLGIEGIAWWRREVEGVPSGVGDDVYTMFNNTDYHPFVLFLGDIITSKTRELKKTSVVAAIYATFLANETEARTFWAATARGGEAYDDTAITSKLDKWLRDLFEETDARKGMHPANYFQGCIFAWNAHREGRTISTIKFEAKKGLSKVAQ